jgi:hypothetical protein
MSTNMLFEQIGCNKSSPADSLKCAQAADISTILAKLAILSYQVTFRLVLDNVTFSKTIDQLVETKSFKPCKLITGKLAIQPHFLIF